MNKDGEPLSNLRLSISLEIELLNNYKTLLSYEAVVNHFMHALGIPHVEANHRILWCLKPSLGIGILCKSLVNLGLL